MSTPRNLDEAFLEDWVNAGDKETLSSKAQELGYVSSEAFSKQLIAALCSHGNVSLHSLLSILGPLAEIDIGRLFRDHHLTEQDREVLGDYFDHSLLHLYDDLCRDGARFFSFVMPPTDPNALDNVALSLCVHPSKKRHVFVLKLFSHPLFAAIKVLFQMPASGDTARRVSSLTRAIADLVLTDTFWQYSVIRNFMICCCAVIVASRWAFLNLTANFFGHFFQRAPLVSEKGESAFPRTVTYGRYPITLVFSENGASGGAI
jgi:hypothetical protein